MLREPATYPPAKGARGEAPKLAPFFRLTALDVVGSTNDEAMRLAAQGAGAGTLVWAKTQTRGRGRRGRSWASPHGNLYLSLVLRPDCPVATAGQLNFVAALGIGEALAALVPQCSALHYKWPNDVLLDVRKVAGVLLESSGSGKDRFDWLVLGVGVNLRSFPEGTDYPATCLEAEGAEAISVASMLASFCEAFLSWLERWEREGFAPVRAKWLERATALGERIEVRLDAETLAGTFAGLDESGALILHKGGGQVLRITAGDVFFPSAAD
ncbi:MAG: biotin--[acetyl-CoA-carboxylase] ligase [Alphaproteobacteria bacterium]